MNHWCVLMIPCRSVAVYSPNDVTTDISVTVRQCQTPERMVKASLESLGHGPHLNKVTAALGFRPFLKVGSEDPSPRLPRGSQAVPGPHGPELGERGRGPTLSQRVLSHSPLVGAVVFPTA